jgi:hypothetical protein
MRFASDWKPYGAERKEFGAMAAIVKDESPRVFA